MKNSPNNSIELNPSVDNKDYERVKRETEIAAKLHEGISRRLYSDLNKFRERLSEEQIAAYETALQDIKEVKTIKGATKVLKILFDKIFSDAERMPDKGNDAKERLLEVAQKIAELKTPDSLAQMVDSKIITY